VYDERITIKVTGKMLADLENVTRKNGQTLSAVVRQAIRNYLDGTDLTLGTRRTFDRRFQKRMDEFEQNLAQPGAGLETDGADPERKSGQGAGHCGVPRAQGGRGGAERARPKSQQDGPGAS
jgi:hypothetical protein